MRDLVFDVIGRTALKWLTAQIPKQVYAHQVEAMIDAAVTLRSKEEGGAHGHFEAKFYPDGDQALGEHAENSCKS